MTREEAPGVVVPVKAPGRSKTRLAPSLSREERRHLVLALVRHMVHTLVALTHDVEPLFVSDSRRVRRLAERGGIPCVPDPPGPGTPGEIVDRVIADRLETATGTLVLPVDLPLLSPGSLDSLLREGRDCQVVVVPDRAEEGTNALWRHTPSAPPCQWRGTRSFRAHRRAARRHDVELRVMRPPDITFDLDTPNDLETLRREEGSLPDPVRNVLVEPSDRVG